MADAINRRELAEQYGMAWAVLKNEPELWRLFQKAYGNGRTRWSPEKFKSQFQSTKWYQRHSESWRKARILQLSDPKSYAAEVARVQSELSRMATERGLVISERNLPLYAAALFKQGRTDMASMLEYLEGEKGRAGTAGSTTSGLSGQAVQELEKMAWEYGYTPSDKSFYQRAATNVALGNATIEQYQEEMRKGAASKYRVFSEQILSGAMTVRDLASTYIDAMSRTLELNPDQIDLEDEQIQKAIATSFDDKGNPVAKSVWQFTKDLKNDPRWAYTKNAKDSMESTAVGVLRAFGFEA